MTSYLIKVLILILFSFFIIYSYYFLHPVHIENFDGYFSYFLIIGIIYGIYKYFQVELNEGNEKVVFSPLKILGFFILHLLILCILFFSFNGLDLSNGFVLFFKILGYSILPVTIMFIVIAFGKKVISYLPHTKEESDIYRFLISLGIGFFSFLFLIASFGVLGFYNLGSVFLILGFFLVVSYKELFGLFSGLVDYKIEYDIEEGSYLKLLSTEFLFLVSTLVLSTSLIYIIRPFPIGWDDLGAYMNIPHLMSEAGSLISFGGMSSWQTFTGIGYLFGSTTQAFFLNIVGGFISFIAIALITSDLLKSDKKGFINIPLLSATIFISLPMVVFQQAKDMKLDAGLFFVSIILLYILFKTFRKSESNSRFFKKLFSNFIKDKEDNEINNLNYFLDNNDFLTDKKLTLKLVFIIGILAGFAFSIKFTSLLLISSIIGVLFYTEIGFAGFLGYLGLFFAFFTKLGLWSYMNIAYDKTDTVFVNTFSLISALIGILFLVIGFFRHKKNIKKLFSLFLVFILGVLFSLLPWLGKNIYQSYPDISVGTILSGKTDRFNFDKSLIYSEEELKLKEELIVKGRGLDDTGTTKNEDFGRYFGYESGINNYIKLPWNLTMQKNQGGEFTDIGYLFLALLPVILLFLPFRNIFYYFSIFGLLLLEIAVFVFGFGTPFFSSFTLPGGYLILFLLFLFLLLFLLYGLKNTKKENFNIISLFKLNLIFASFYTFLWSISAFGIVWYGIVMYFSFLLMIAIGAYYISSYNESDDEKEIYAKSIGSIALFLVILIYFVNSVFPHTFNNLKGASYIEYKVGQVNDVEAPYLYHPEYIKILFDLNIDDTKREEFFKSTITEDIQNIVTGINNAEIDVIINTLRKLKKDPNFSFSAQRSLINIFEGITNPEEKFKEKSGIYRIGTFLKYYISENNKRLLEDSLVFNFNDYIYDENTDITVERLKKIGIKYLLVDLNAATIDKDERHNLTKRYENLLSTFRNDKLELIETDSVCLKTAIESYRMDNEFEKFMIIAGVNYESYIDGKTIYRTEKAKKCYEFINHLFNSNQVTNTSYTYLIPYLNHIRHESNKGKFDTEAQVINFLHSQIGKSFKVLFKVK